MPSDIVIIGGGIAGVSTAYFLAQADVAARITIVEGTEIAAGASGKSGGFLAKDWHGTPTASLSAMSYDLHAELAEKYGGAEKWGYRTVDTLSVEVDASAKKRTPSVPWAHNVVSSRKLGGHDTTAQVHPGLLTRFLAEQFLTRPNTRIEIARVESLRAAAVVTDKGEIPADCVVLAAGPWTGRLAEQILGKRARKLGVQGHRAHSIIVQADVSPHCLFTSMTLDDGSMGEPEVYPRPDGTVYICGAGDSEPLPDTAADVQVSHTAIAKLHQQAAALADFGETISEQACYLPIADRGRPLIGKVQEGLYILSG
jgi:glycine/D-amino acid oxidase-like deaminating enzyme